MVDALVSGTSAERRGGSSPLLGTRDCSIEAGSDVFVRLLCALYMQNLFHLVRPFYMQRLTAPVAWVWAF